VVVFALSAGLAGVGGAVYGSAENLVSPADFNTFLSLVFIVVVVTTGVHTIEGAIQAGMAYVIIGEVLGYLPSARWKNLLLILFGLGAITYALHPEGIVELEKRVWIERFNRLRERSRGDDGSGPAGDLQRRGEAGGPGGSRRSGAEGPVDPTVVGGALGSPSGA
jgi:hypothetical protein